VKFDKIHFVRHNDGCTIITGEFIMIKNVIFDLDGTLIDTEKYYRRAWPVALKHFGYDMTDEMALSLRSLGRPYAPERFKEWFGQDFDYWKVREYRKGIVRKYMDEEGINLKPGATELLTFLREKSIMRAVATANNYGRTEKLLKEIGLFDCFDKIICADMVERGKPSPDIYSYAVKMLDAKPGECFAVEDSPNGMNSAFSAGLKAIYVPDQSEVDDEVRPYIYKSVKTLSDIIELIKIENCM